MRRLTLRYARWDMSVAWLVDPRSNDVLARIMPLDKVKNTDGRRRSLEPVDKPPEPDTDDQLLPPLMRSLLAEQQATGLPPAYIPKPETEDDDDE